MPLFPTRAWLAEYVEKVNASTDYAAAAATWEGDISFVIEAEPDKRVPEDVWLWMDLWHGTCREGEVVTHDRGALARYVIRAPYTRWKEVLRRELEPVKGMMQGKLKLLGDLPTIIRYVRAATELVNIAGTVETVFPDEV